MNLFSVWIEIFRLMSLAAEAARRRGYAAIHRWKGRRLRERWERMERELSPSLAPKVSRKQQAGLHMNERIELTSLRWWHWLWFAPVTVAVLRAVEWPLLKGDYMALKLFTARWVWAVVFSPSALVFLNVVWAAAVLPILGLAAVWGVSSSQQAIWKRWLCSVLVIIVIFLIPIVAEALMWGTFPFIIDSEGVSRLRLIPFIPWPSGDFGYL